MKKFFKDNKAFVIIISILIILCIIVLVYVLATKDTSTNKVNNKNTESIKNNKNKNINTKDNSSVKKDSDTNNNYSYNIDDYIELIELPSIRSIEEVTDSLGFKDNDYFIINSLNYMSFMGFIQSTNTNSISTDDFGSDYYGHSVYQALVDVKYPGTGSLSEIEFSKVINKLYGDNFYDYYKQLRDNVNNKNYYSSVCVTYKYNKEKNTYNSYGGCGGTVGPAAPYDYYKLVSTTNNKVIINHLYIVPSKDKEYNELAPYNVYNNSTDMTYLGQSNSKEDIYTLFKDKSETYEYTYNIENGIYKFNKVTRIKK